MDFVMDRREMIISHGKIPVLPPPDLAINQSDRPGQEGQDRVAHPAMNRITIGADHVPANDALARCLFLDQGGRAWLAELHEAEV